jgi:O-antigen/teichoic acid export membrane protein
MNLQQKAYRGAGWSGFSGIISSGLEVLKYILLARILEPAEFGLLAMAMVIINISRVFADGGTSNAVIHFRNQTNRQLSTLYWINIFAGAGLFLIIFAASPLVAIFYQEPETGRILQLAGVMIPIYSAGALYEVLLRKHLLFKKISISELSGAMAGFITAIFLALAGFGVYALIWSHIITACFLSVLFIWNGRHIWRPSLVFNPGEVRSHLGFGLYQMGERGLNIYSVRIDQLIIGRFFGPEVLGAYHLAFQIILFPLIKISPLINRVAFPVFSNRKDDDEALRTGYLKLMNGIIGVLAPFFLIAGLTAPWLVPALFGQGWELAIRMIPFMAAIGFIKMLGNPSGNIILSKGKANRAFYWTLAVAISNTAIFITGALHSVFVLLLLYSIANLVYFRIGQHILVNSLIGLSWTQYTRAILPFLSTLFLPFICTGLLRVFLELNEVYWDSGIILLVLVSFYMILYVPVLWYFQSGIIRDFFQAFRS